MTITSQSPKQLTDDDNRDLLEMMKIIKFIQSAHFPEYLPLNHHFVFKAGFFKVELHLIIHFSLGSGEKSEPRNLLSE